MSIKEDTPLVRMLEGFLLNPESDFYLSKILYSPTGKALDPLLVSNLDLGTINVEGVPVSIVVNSMQVCGLSNVSIIYSDGKPDIVVEGDEVAFHAHLPNSQPGYVRPPDVPAKLKMTGDLSVSMPGAKGLPGKISTTITSVNDVTGVFTATQTNPADPKTVNIAVTKVQITPVETSKNISIVVDTGSVFDPTINAMLNTPEIFTKIIGGGNSALAKPSVLKKLSQYATNAARKAIGKIIMI